MLESATIYLKKAEPPKKEWYRHFTTWEFFIDVLLLLLLYLSVVLVQYGYIPHAKQGFYCGDPEISHKYQGECVSSKTLFATTFLIPILIIWVVERIRRDGVSFNKGLQWYRGYFVNLGAFLISAEILKVVSGALRPHFLHTCAPDAAQNCTVGDYITEYQCLNTHGFQGHIVVDSSLSFPSGHAGVAITMSFFCVAYMQVRFQTHNIGAFIKPLLCGIVFSWGFAVGISRMVCHRHHWWDVLVGTILGIVFVMYTIICHCDCFKVTTKHTSCKSHICDRNCGQNCNCSDLVNETNKDSAIS